MGIKLNFEFVKNGLYNYFNWKKPNENKRFVLKEVDEFNFVENAESKIGKLFEKVNLIQENVQSKHMSLEELRRKIKKGKNETGKMLELLRELIQRRDEKEKMELETEAIQRGIESGYAKAKKSVASIKSMYKKYHQEELSLEEKEMNLEKSEIELDQEMRSLQMEAICSPLVKDLEDLEIENPLENAFKIELSEDDEKMLRNELGE